MNIFHFVELFHKLQGTKLCHNQKLRYFKAQIYSVLDAKLFCT